MNEEKMSVIYQKIAGNAVETIPEEWTKVYLYGEIAEGVRKSYFFNYPVDNTKPVYSHDIPEIFQVEEEKYDLFWYQLLDFLQELKEEFESHGEEPWTSLTMMFNSAGDFKIDYDYEDLSEADDHERSIIWENRYLGLVPEDEDDKLFLETYLKQNGLKQMYRRFNVY